MQATSKANWPWLLGLPFLCQSLDNVEPQLLRLESSCRDLQSPSTSLLSLVPLFPGVPVAGERNDSMTLGTSPASSKSIRAPLLWLAVFTNYQA